jgi:hypothetical protein
MYRQPLMGGSCGVLSIEKIERMARAKAGVSIFDLHG